MTSAPRLLASQRSVSVVIGANDNANGMITFTAPAFQFAEDDGAAAVTLERQGARYGDAVVAWAIRTDSTTPSSGGEAGADFAATTGNVTVAAGSTSGVLEIPIRADTLPEQDETFVVSLHRSAYSLAQRCSCLTPATS